MTSGEDPSFAIQSRQNLRASLAARIEAQIAAGDLLPGQRLPTEQAIMDATGVSRTVVREALATLRAKGLISTRQGLGAFVAEPRGGRSFSIVPRDIESISEVLRVLELRMGIEAEAASLAAERRTEEDLERLDERLAALTAALDAGSAGAAEDYAFHRAILGATHNPYFGSIFDPIESALVPRQFARIESLSPAERRRHARRMQREHRAIVEAIRAGNPGAARSALRKHLTLSAARFAELRARTEGGEGGMDD